MLGSVAVLVLDNLAMFEFGTVCEVFGIDRESDGVPRFDFRVCGPQAGRPLRTSVGVQVIPEHGLDGLVGADLVAVPAAQAADGPHPYPPEALAALRAAAKAGSTILTVCTGAFVAGAAGLGGRRGRTTPRGDPREIAREDTT